jgi:hypothetical protein
VSVHRLLLDRKVISLLTILAGHCVPELRAQQGDPALVQALRDRARALDRLYVEYDWRMQFALPDRDPFDRSNWLNEFRGLTALSWRYRAWILRPHYRLQYSGPHESQTDVNWLDGIHTRRSLQKDGSWFVYRDGDWFNTVGPLPTITPLELWQVFDVSQSLLDLAQEGRIRPVAQWGPFVRVSGGPLYPPPSPPWSLQADLDPSRGYLPVLVTLETPVAGGRIRWEMRTIDSVPVLGSVHAIKEAVIALRNTSLRGALLKKWMIYHYLASELRRDENLSRTALEIAIPAANVSLIDEVNLLSKEIDAQGRVLREEHWTPEERREQLQALRETYQRVEAGQETLRVRKTTMAALIGGSAGITLLVFGVWWWRRVRRLAS